MNDTVTDKSIFGGYFKEFTLRNGSGLWVSVVVMQHFPAPFAGETFARTIASTSVTNSRAGY